MDFHDILHQDVLLNFMGRLSAGITWDNNIGGLTLVISKYFFAQQQNLKTSKRARAASHVVTMKVMFLTELYIRFEATKLLVLMQIKISM
jgi:hypothetical protein